MKKSAIVIAQSGIQAEANKNPDARNHKTPDFFRNQGFCVLNVAVKERFELSDLLDQQIPNYGAFSVHSSTIE
jgi:hypothetical protein